MKFEKKQEIQLFIGLYDKDTKKQEIASNTALQYVNDLLTMFFEGATSFICNGIYKHIDGTTVCEPSISILLYDVDVATVQEFCDKVKTTLNQESLLVKENQVSICFY